MNITEINRATNDVIITAINNALKDLGLDAKARVTSFSARQAQITVTAATGAGISLADTPAGRNFTAYARSYGLDPNLLGRTFTLSGSSRAYRITGLTPSRPKYPVDGEELGTGRTFKFTIHQVRAGNFIGA